MENENMFEKVLYLSKLSLDLVLLQYKLIHELLDKLEKYEDVTEYRQLVDSLEKPASCNEEDKNKDETK